MKRILIVLLLLSIWGMRADSTVNYPPYNSDVQLTSTNLPIVWIEVNGDTIKRDERITARMKIIHNGDGCLNYADTLLHPGQTIDYEGYIALRYRGNTSFTDSDKKPYSFRPLDKPLEEGGTKKKVNILGMGKDNNWAIIAPFEDKSMIRDILAFEISRPWMEYTPKGKHCELILDGIYYGVHVLTEVVSKGKHRLNLDDPGVEGDEVTGGYIVEIDRPEEFTHISKYHPVDTAGTVYEAKNIHFQYKSPEYEEMVQEQLDYINNRIDEMEDALYAGFGDVGLDNNPFIDPMSFIDYQIAMEFSHNIDAYRLSCKMFKRRDSEDSRFKLVVWDMNLAYGNTDNYNGWYTDTWIYEMNYMLRRDKYMMPFWWMKLNSDSHYIDMLKDRWAQYRRNNLREDRLMATVDSLADLLTSHDAEYRNTQAWPRWGAGVLPYYYVANNFQEEIAWLKEWLAMRLAWMDEQLGFDPNAHLRGDANGDGKVSISDVTVLIDYLIGGNPANIDFDACDCDLNSSVGISDVTALIDYLLTGTWSSQQAQ